MARFHDSAWPLITDSRRATTDVYQAAPRTPQLIEVTNIGAKQSQDTAIMLRRVLARRHAWREYTCQREFKRALQRVTRRVCFAARRQGVGVMQRQQE